MIFRTCSGGISSLAGSTYPNFLDVPYLFAFNACHLRAARDKTTNTIHIHPSVSRASHITRQHASSRASDDAVFRIRDSRARPSRPPLSLSLPRSPPHTHAHEHTRTFLSNLLAHANIHIVPIARVIARHCAIGRTPPPVYPRSQRSPLPSSLSTGDRSRGCDGCDARARRDLSSRRASRSSPLVARLAPPSRCDVAARRQVVFQSLRNCLVMIGRLNTSQINPTLRDARRRRRRRWRWRRRWRRWCRARSVLGARARAVGERCG